MKNKFVYFKPSDQIVHEVRLSLKKPITVISNGKKEHLKYCDYYNRNKQNYIKSSSLGDLNV
jgi:hypothetical protein